MGVENKPGSSDQPNGHSELPKRQQGPAYWGPSSNGTILLGKAELMVAMVALRLSARAHP